MHREAGRFVIDVGDGGWCAQSKSGEMKQALEMRGVTELKVGQGWFGVHGETLMVDMKKTWYETRVVRSVGWSYEAIRGQTLAIGGRLKITCCVRY